MSRKTDRFEIKAIENAFVLERNDYDYDRSEWTFKSWDDLVKFLKDNPPRRAVTSEDTKTEVIKFA